MRRFGVVCFALVLALAGVVGPATAEGTWVDDREAGNEAYFLQINRAHFINGTNAVHVEIRHGGLVPRYVDRFDVWIRTGKALHADNRATYILRRDNHGLRLLRQVPGQESATVVRCRGDKMIVTAGKGGTNGHVTAVVPHRCLQRSQKVRLGYLVWNEGGSVVDSAPNGPSGLLVPGFTRWLRRG